MKLVLVVIAILMAFLVFFKLCKRMGIDVNALLISLFGKQNIPQAQIQPVEESQCLMRTYGVFYEAFAFLIWNCLNAIFRICGLECPDSVSGIYCARITDRIKVSNGRVVFFYEIPVACTGGISNGKFHSGKIEVEKIQQTFESCLPEYMDNGFFFTGKICVWPIDQHRVRIEVQGVERQYQNPNFGGIEI